MYVEENSDRVVGRILGIGKNMVPVLGSEICAGDRAQRDAKSRVNVIKKDELYSLVERKKQNLRDKADK